MPPDITVLKPPPDMNAAQRARIAPAIVRLLSLWKLTKADQLQILGFAPRRYAWLSRLAAGRPFPDNRDQLERASHLLGIHRALKTLYPENPEMVAEWMVFRNGAFARQDPARDRQGQGLDRSGPATCPSGPSAAQLGCVVTHETRSVWRHKLNGVNRCDADLHQIANDELLTGYPPSSARLVLGYATFADVISLLSKEILSGRKEKA